MKRNWKELGEIWSGRALQQGEQVTVNVFDKALGTLLEQFTFRPKREEHRPQMIWVADLCRHLNHHSTLIRAGVEDESGEWDVLESGYRNKYWNITSRELVVISTVPRAFNWSTERRVALHSLEKLPQGTKLRMNVRTRSGELLETVSFTVSDPKRLTSGLWTKDFSIQINNTSRFVRAGRNNGETVEPYWEHDANWIWIPFNGEFLSVTWSRDGLKDVGKIESDRDAQDGERISFFVFDDVADKLLDRITLVASASKKRLGKAQWPADLARQINASSGHAGAGVRSGTAFTPKDSVNENVISQRYAELRTFTTALHLDNWEEARTLSASYDMQAGWRSIITVTTENQGNFCEVLTFTPDPARLKAAQWAKDAAAYINQHSLYLKAGVKTTTSKTFVPTESADSNLIWLPRDAKLSVRMGVGKLTELGYISSQRELRANEGCKVFVLDDGSEEILREINFTPTNKRTGTSLAPKDLASRVNGQTQLIVAGEQKDSEKPTPVASGYLNTIWGCANEIRAFHTFPSLKNWDKGPQLGKLDLKINQQVIVRVKGSKTGRIFESVAFWPTAGRYGLQAWTQDMSKEINARCRFVRAGEEKPELFIMEPAFSMGANYLWTPKGSGLQVEVEIIPGIAPVLPGMSSEAKQLFDHYAESSRRIFVDPRSGLPRLQIPLADLYADDSLSDPLKVSLAYNAGEGVHLQFGKACLSAELPQAWAANDFILTLRDGRRVRVSNTQEDFNGGDFKISPIHTSTLVGIQCTGVSVTYKDGTRDAFAFASFNKTSMTLLLCEYTLASGRSLKFVYEAGGLKVLKGETVLLEAKRIRMKSKVIEMLGSVVVFPGSKTEKRTFTLREKSEKEPDILIEEDGLASAGKTCYTVSQDKAGRLTGIRVEPQHDFTVDKKTETDKTLCKETLEYTGDGRVKRHDICPGEQMDDLVHEYTYTAEVTRVIAYFRMAAPRTAIERNYRFQNQHSSLEDYGSDEVQICRKHHHRLDEKNKCMLSVTQVWEGDVLVDDQEMRIDAIGNPISRRDNDQTTRYTYYNNYQQFEVRQTEEKVQDWSLFGWLFKALDFINPIGLAFVIGGSGGMTWGTYIKTTVAMKPAKNDYAKDAFNLPVAIDHCGSDATFAGEVESELLTQKVDGVEQAQRLTYFAYDQVDGRTRVKKKLTVLQPDAIEVDVEAAQLKAATAAAAEFIKSLDGQIAATSGNDKKGYETLKAELKKSLVAQSKENKLGYKLKTWKGASMSLDTFDYHTDAQQPGFGTVKSIETVLLTDKGARVESSLRTTTFDYTVDGDLLTIKTTLARAGETSIVSSQTRSRLTGRLHGSVDSEGVETAFTYDPQGNLTSETASKDGKTRHSITCSLQRKLVARCDLVEGGTTTRLERDSLGRRTSLSLKPAGASSFLETRRWEYDRLGRVSKSTESDYGKGNRKVSQREVKRTYAPLTGAISISNVLKDGNGKELANVSQTQQPCVKGERFVQGRFSVERQFNSARKVFVEHYASSDGGACKIERSLSAEGLLKSIRYLKIDKSGKETEHDAIVFEYDKHARMTKVSPKEGAASSFTYDAAGRLLSTTRDGTELGNRYPDSSLAAVAAEGYVKRAGKEHALGSQTVDLLGRVSSQTVRQLLTEFSYAGVSTAAQPKAPGAAPAALDGYASSTEESTRTHSQTATETSTLLFSTSGRVLSFNDLTGATTGYEYDFFDRVTRSVNEHCESVFTYADNGLLVSETVKALKAGNLTMTVSYHYDELGQEVRRTFTCAGMDKLDLERTLLADGRLRKSTLKSTKQVKDKTTQTEVHSDSYTYDSSLRLSQWEPSDTLALSYSYDALGNIELQEQAGSLDRHRFYYMTTAADSLLRTQKFRSAREIPVGLAGPPISHDSAGRLTLDGDRQISYHDNGQVNTYSLDAGASQYTFSYDSEGRVRGGTRGTRTETFHYRGDRVYAVVRGDSAKGGVAKRTLVLRNESRGCLMQDANADGKESRSFELRDANGTVFASLDLATKAITWFRYEPYGKRYSGSKSDNWLGFKGEALNLLDLHYLGNGYRLYDPEWGRFLSPDSWSPFGAGGAAAYAYGDGDPVNKHDPSGHQVVAQYERWGTMPFIQTTAFRVAVGAMGVLLAPFTAGMSALAAIATTALAAVSFVLDVTSLLLAESDPALSRTLEAWGQVFAICSAAAGAAMTVNGWKGMPRKWLSQRGGGATPRSRLYEVRAPKDLQRVLQAREAYLSKLATGYADARAAGGNAVRAFEEATFMPAGALGTEQGVNALSTYGAGRLQRAGQTTRNLFVGLARQFDESLLDAWGKTLDMYSGPNTLVQSFVPRPPEATTLVSIVAGPLGGRERFPA
ncbi:RHS repeat-associated core domain-containing protein [Pseudomonas japonica]|uniref:RHS repeat-associated core domain-containing protein n=1 Tax=Pseudomonas japonica TaxID=256466 RepID=A0A239LIF5_9PSED|nr:RHS repeat-associated core domain-containing protein [Pseudomonas japonica]SNT29623.1 RHS repeat-associated core domain-containing protein [Pseudomonas japonica]